MSALQFQKVMAHLIRFPTDSWEETEARFPGDLTEREKNSLEKMAEDPLVRKFGYKMRFLRLRDASVAMRLTKDLVDPQTLQHLFVEYFEPSRTRADLFLIGVNFLEFCLSDARCLKRLDQIGPELRDVVRYEAARAGIERQSIRENDPTLPAGSKLAHQAFTIIDLDYDVPAIDRIKVKDPSSRDLPRPRKIKLLILRSQTAPYYRMYEIDREIENFLDAQRANPADFTGALPPAYGAMVNCGLCRK